MLFEQEERPLTTIFYLRFKAQVGSLGARGWRGRLSSIRHPLSPEFAGSANAAGGPGLVPPLANSSTWSWAHKGCFNATRRTRILATPHPVCPPFRVWALNDFLCLASQDLWGVKHFIVCLKKRELKLAPCETFSRVTDLPGTSRKNVAKIVRAHRQRMESVNSVPVALLIDAARLKAPEQHLHTLTTPALGSRDFHKINEDTYRRDVRVLVCHQFLRIPKVPGGL